MNEQAPGVVKIRLSGAAQDVALAADLLVLVEDSFEVLDRSAPKLNRREPGERVYLTLRITEPARSTP